MLSFVEVSIELFVVLHHYSHLVVYKDEGT